MSSRGVKYYMCTMEDVRDRRGRNGTFSLSRALQEAARKIKREVKMLEK